jgi:hypothetical protein
LPPTFIDRAGRWFLHSGIQEAGGGVARYYRSDTGRNNPVSTEITGYAVSTLVYLHALTGEEVYVSVMLLLEALAGRKYIPVETTKIMSDGQLGGSVEPVHGRHEHVHHHRVGM